MLAEILVSESSSNVTFYYTETEVAVQIRVQSIEHVFEYLNVSLRLTSLQFSLRHILVTSVISGVLDSHLVRDNLEMMRLPIFQVSRTVSSKMFYYIQKVRFPEVKSIELYFMGFSNLNRHNWYTFKIFG